MMNHPLYIVCGAPGVGKTTYAETLAKKHGAVLLDIDTVTEPVVMAGLALAGQDPQDRDSQTFKASFRASIYRALLDTAKHNLPCLPVVVVGPFTRELAQADWKTALEKELDTTVSVHFIYCDALSRKQRILSRGQPRDQTKLADWCAHDSYAASVSRPAFEHVFIDTSNK